VEFVMRRHAVVLAALAWLISIEGAEARLDILVDKATQRMLVIQDGYMRYIWPVSTGRDEMATPSGVYTPQRLERNWFSSAYYNSPMPYSIFFHNGYAIHGSYAINQLGGPASHGCVRLHPHHAALLFDLVQQEGADKTTIEVTDLPRPDEPPSQGREIAAGPGPYPPAPRVIRYRESGDMAELPPAPRVNRSVAARNILPPKPAPTPAVRHSMPTEVVAEASPKPAPTPAVRRPMPTEVVAEASPKPAPTPAVRRPMPTEVVAEASPPERPQQAPSAYGFKVLPATCWSGGASRWRWWNSGQAAACK
jgi:L,D-transpeptidase catalytic domain